MKRLTLLLGIALMILAAPRPATADAESFEKPTTVQPATAPATAAEGEVLPDPDLLVGLPPGVAAQVRQQLGTQLVRALDDRETSANALAFNTHEFGSNDWRVRENRTTLESIDRRITALKAAIAGPSPADARGAGPAATARPVLLSWTVLRIVATHIGLVVGGWWIWLHLNRGFGRRSALFFFAAVLVVGIGEMFLAGVLIGMSRPAESAALIVGCAALLIGMGLWALPRINRVYAEAELRKMRVLDGTA